MQKLSKDNVLKPNFPLWVYFRDDSNTKVFPQNSSMNSIAHNKKKKEKIEKKMQKEVKRPNQISIKVQYVKLKIIL